MSLLHRPFLFSIRSSSIGSSSALLRCRRTFFASSTDHTRLLQEAEVHCLVEEDDNETGINKRQYVLVDYGMDLATVKKVPQLHLGRLFLEGNTIYGAKVVNRTLGECSVVWGKLLEAALEDVRKQQTSSREDTEIKATRPF
ncbi:hypothetical protein IV203_011826 [Nitzschia inconspicua]|uniref:Uncharacterized protein n=1 Tax=Nitzschia inconspicua TaxID=303405 RepID=A0A9K3PLC7_9STRA|nr:hypothetical protein IV203_011826 [Nitzschia inconspicua]